MGKHQYAQKVDPSLKIAIEGLTNQYLSENRILEKGEMVSLLYKDHLEKEKEREAIKTISKGDVLNSYLNRISELFIENTREHESIMEMVATEHQREVEFLQLQIRKLEGSVGELTRQLEEKTLEKKNAEDTIRKLKKKITH